MSWPGRSPGTVYSWYAVADDTLLTTQSPTWTFTTTIGNIPPVFSIASPPNNAIGIPVTIHTLNININDPDNDLFDWTIETVPNIGSSSGTLDNNGIKSCSVSGLDHLKTYKWYVNATDPSGSGTWTKEVYSFTTRPPKDNDPPIIQLVYPKGGEILEGKTTIKWYAADDEYPGEKNNKLPIYIYYSANDGETWREINNDLPLMNTGEYEWDTKDYSDGSYLILIEAKDSHNNIAAESSDPFTIDNGNAGVKISDIKINDITIKSEKYVKDGDNIEITAGITGSFSLGREDIIADLSGFNLGNVVAESYDGFTAKWTINNVICSPTNGILTVKISASDQHSKSDTIIADNTNPEINIIKPENGFYFFNSRLLPIQKTIIIGPLTVIADGIDENGISKSEFYLDGELMHTDNSDYPEWYMRIKQRGQHNLEIKVYDNAGNSVTETRMVTVFNFFGN